MGLSLRFRLSARGPFVRDDAAALLDLLGLFSREALLVESAAILTVRFVGGREETETVSSSRLPDRLAPLIGQKIDSLEVRGLRTAEHFPNPFWQYTLGEEVIAAWMNVHHTCQPAASRRFEIEFVEPEFLGDTPSLSPHRLVAKLKTVLGTSLTPECLSTEAEQARV